MVPAPFDLWPPRAFVAPVDQRDEAPTVVGLSDFNVERGAAKRIRVEAGPRLLDEDDVRLDVEQQGHESVKLVR